MSVKLRKANRVIEVKEEHAAGYLLRGYDRINAVGKVVEPATGGKTVSVAEHNKMIAVKDAAITKLEERCAELYDQANGVSQEEFDKLQEAFQAQAQELDEVKTKAEKFAEKGKQLEAENVKLKKQLNK